MRSPVGVEALLRLGYTEAELGRVGPRLDTPGDIRGVLDSFGYFADWRSSYRVRSVRASLRGDRLTCIDAAILAYGLLEAFPAARRRLLGLHRRAPDGEECGHVVTLYSAPDGRVGAFSKSSFAGLDHREPVHADDAAVARTYAEAYLRLGLRPLYYGVTTLEEIAPDLDFRFHEGDLNALSERIQARYEYAFEIDGQAPLGSSG